MSFGRNSLLGFKKVTAGPKVKPGGCEINLFQSLGSNILFATTKS